jgi:hypothetical protein
MKKITFIVVLFLAFTLNCYGGWLDKGTQILNQFKNQNSAKSSDLTVGEIAGGLKDALRVGTENVVKQLGREDGFLKDDYIHIPLPENLQKIRNVLSKVGMAGTLNDLEVKLNRAAEIATPKAKELFWKAISEMTIEDVNKIYKGPKDAATQYFKSKRQEKQRETDSLFGKTEGTTSPLP